MAWGGEFLAATRQDWFALPGCASRADREAAEVEQRGEDVFLIDRRSGERRKLDRPVVAGWNRQSVAAQATPARLPESVDEINAAVPLPGQFDADRFAADGRGDLAEAIDRLAAQPALRAQLRRRGLARVASHYTNRAIARRTYEIYCELFEGKAAEP